MVTERQLYIKITLITVSILAFLPLCFRTALAQQDTAEAEVETRLEPDLYLGVYGGLAGISHSGLLQPDFFANRPVFPPESSFREGYGVGGSGGLLLEIPFGEVFMAGLRIGYDSRSAQMTQSYTNLTEVKNPDGSTQTARVVGTLDATLPYLNATPYLHFAPVSFPLYFQVGPTVLLPLSPSYDYSESVSNPAGAVFRSSNSKSRTLAKGDLASATTMMGVTVGAGTNLELNDRMKLFLEVQYSPMFGNVSDKLRSNEEWKISSFGGTIGIRYALGGRTVALPPVMPPPPVVAQRDTMEIPIGDTLFAAGIVTPEGLRDTLALSTQSIKSTEIHPLLPYVFFDKDSAAIPDRYVRFERKETRDWELERIPRGNTLGVYHQVLNIVGQRMYRLRRDRKAMLTVTGCLSQFENGDTALARRRAETVRDYLVSTWRLRPDRVDVAVRPYPGLPAIPSLSEVDTVEGALENQRVEISATDQSVLAPVELRDTALLGTAGVVRFVPPDDTLGEYDYWSLDVAIGDSVVEQAVTGFGTPPKHIDVPVEKRQGLDLADTVRISSRFVVRDTMFQEVANEKSRQVVILQKGELEEEPEIRDGKYVTELSLFLFGFDQSDLLEFSRQATPILQRRIQPTSTVTVIGHTDRIGLPPYNRALSLRRAQAAADALGVPVKNVVGKGEKDLLYDNDYPEGRYYCRTVTVLIETPVETADAARPSGAGHVSEKNAVGMRGGEN